MDLKPLPFDLFRFKEKTQEKDQGDTSLTELCVGPGFSDAALVVANDFTPQRTLLFRGFESIQ